MKILPPANAPEPMAFEPKLDGYRLVVVRDGDNTSLWSRQKKNRYLPKLVETAARMVPAGCILDGKAVVWPNGRMNFEALQEGSPRARTARPVRERPARLVAFDVLCVASHDARALPFRNRRALLEKLATVWSPPLSLSPLSTDRDLDLHWFRDPAGGSFEGLMVKNETQPYLGGKRIWGKFKRISDLDVVCGAVIGPIDRPTEIVAGLPIEGELRIVSRSSVLSETASRGTGPMAHTPGAPAPVAGGRQRQNL